MLVNALNVDKYEPPSAVQPLFRLKSTVRELTPVKLISAPEDIALVITVDVTI